MVVVVIIDGVVEGGRDIVRDTLDVESWFSLSLTLLFVNSAKYTENLLEHLKMVGVVSITDY